MQARRRGERSLLVRPGKIRVRETPPKVLAMRERQRSRAAAKAGRKQRKDTGAAASLPPSRRPWPSRPGPPGPPGRRAAAVRRSADRRPASGWRARRTPAWSIRADEHDVYEPAPVPVLLEELRGREVHGFVRAPDPETAPRARPPSPKPPRRSSPPAGSPPRPGPRARPGARGRGRRDEPLPRRPARGRAHPSVAARLNATVPDSASRTGPRPRAPPGAGPTGAGPHGSWSNGSRPAGSGPAGSRSDGSRSNGSRSDGSPSNERPNGDRRRTGAR